MRNRDARIVNQNELRVIGMSRSGNHAIIQWIMAQAAGRVCFLNCTEGKSNPFLTARPMDDERPYQTNIPGFDWAAEQRGEFSAKRHLIFSHEDNFLANACSAEFERRHDEFVGPSGRRFDVLILRDPFNLFASRLRNMEGQVPLRAGVRIWKQHAREFLGEGRLRATPVLINYNRWFLERDYRRSVAQQLGLNFTDAGRRDVANCNGGSSFDGKLYHGQAHRMNVLQRWRHFEDDERFRAIFDQQMIEMSERIFGPIPGTEELWEPARAVA